VSFTEQNPSIFNQTTSDSLTEPLFSVEQVSKWILYQYHYMII